MHNSDALYLVIGHAGADSRSVQIPRGYVLLTLVLAGWGVASVVALAIWGILGLPLGPLLLGAAGIGVVAYAIWRWFGRSLLIVWLEKLIEDDKADR